MNAQRLLQHFNRIAEAPDAIPRLRQFILDLAVRGKLVEQDPNDEPASELLQRIHAEKLRLVKKGKIRKQNLQSEMEPDESPFILPIRWAWARLGDIIHLVSGQHLQPGEYSDQQQSGPPYITGPADFGQNGLVITRYAIVRKAVAKRGQILLTVKGAGVGKTAFCDLPEVAISRQLMAMTAIDWNQRFLLLTTHELGEALKKSARSLIPGISREDVDQFVFPLPPLAEQQRIVAKVDELMALCDGLAAAQAERESRRDRLVAATHARLADLSPVNFQPSIFFINHLPHLTTRPEHIQQLRQTILSLAVSGQLVPHDPQDEPVAELLSRIDEERAVTAKTDRRADPDTQELLADELCWTLPATWRWRGMADLALFIDYRGKTPAKTASGIRLITAKNVRPGFINLEPEEFVTKATYNAWMTRGLPREGDILFTTEAPMGNAAVVRIQEEFGLAQRVINFRLYGGVDPDFLVFQLLSQPFQAILEETATGLTAKGIKAAKLKRLPVAIPPLAEQRRIVAKVKELLAVCDRLEAQLTTTQTESRRVLEATLHEAVAGHDTHHEGALQ